MDPFSVSTRVLCQDHSASSQKKAPSSTSPAAPSRAEAARLLDAIRWREGPARARRPRVRSLPSGGLSLQVRRSRREHARGAPVRPERLQGRRAKACGDGKQDPARRRTLPAPKIGFQPARGRFERARLEFGALDETSGALDSNLERWERLRAPRIRIQRTRHDFEHVELEFSGPDETSSALDWNSADPRRPRLQ